MRFVNREVSTPNKKILTVEDVSYNQTTGEISQLIVTETNNEGDVTVEGTKLNADNLNNAFEDLNRNKFLHFYYKEVFGIVIDEELFTIELTGVEEKYIPIACDYSLHPVIRNNTYLDIDFNGSETTLIVQMKPTYQSSSRSGSLYVEYYKESAHTHLVCILNIKYIYTPASTNPLD